MDRMAPGGAISRRQAGRALTAICALSGAVLLVDAAVVEPGWVEVSRHIEPVQAWKRTAPDLSVVHLSDLHVGEVGARERQAIAAINESRPDLILVSGDLVRSSSHLDDLATFLSALHARYGKFAVWGNHDHDAGVAGAAGGDVLRAAGVTLLRNAHRRITTRSGTVVIAGVDDPATGHDNLGRALRGTRRSDLTILLSHSPEIAGDLGNWDVDLMLAGHTHGGQIRLPWLDPLWMPFGTRAYVEGWFAAAGGARLHVSRGLGWSGVPLRLLCRPRIDMITLRGGPRPARARRNPGRA